MKKILRMNLVTTCVVSLAYSTCLFAVDIEISKFDTVSANVSTNITVTLVPSPVTDEEVYLNLRAIKGTGGAIFLCSLLLCVVSAPGERDGTMPSEKVVRELEEGGYGLCIQFASVPSITEEEMSASLKALRTSAERRIESVVNSALLAKLQKPYLTPVRGKGTAPDRFVAECQVNDARVMIAVGELKITFNVVPSDPKALSKDEAISCLVDWSKCLFKASGNQTGYAFEVSEKPDFWLIQRFLTGENGIRRDPWTWPESIYMVLDNKHGSWLSVSVRDSLMERFSDPHGPKSTGRGITYGHWFGTRNGQSSDTLKKNAEKRDRVPPNAKPAQ